MGSLHAVTATTVRSWQDELRAARGSLRSVEHGAQLVVERLWAELGDTAALVRLYLALPLQQLGAGDMDAARSAALQLGLHDTIAPNTLALTLMATRGVVPAWNDRTRSRTHRAIPLMNSEMVARLPLLPSLFQQTGVGLSWIDGQSGNTEESFMTETGRTGLFLVDARSSVDSKGRPIVAAREFVEQHKIQSVAGVGGNYLGGSFAGLLLFLRETVDRPTLQRISPLLGSFRAATTPLMLRAQVLDRRA